ncbi:hypothetical protein F0562_011066 [Nyssa sinensis]|uniref:Retrotransposon gag domain-containing protein n=1 Tax=Nyssa sinensis TaxID=561372 RepID=A0A5J5A0T6_9ASTE|nr:hypothetical protein F0562_011066 [Nyssa sinensis]
MKGTSVGGMNYYACLSMLSLLILTAFAIAVEGPQVWAVGWQRAVSLIGPNFIWQQLQALCSEFETLWMKSGESVTDYFSRTMEIVNKMRIHGDKTEDVTIVEKILRSMTLKFNFVVCSIEEANGIEELSIDELQSSLLVHEQKINQQEKEEQALKASTENHSTPRGDRGRGKGRGRGRDRGRGRGSNDCGNQQQHHHQHQENQFPRRG